MLCANPARDKHEIADGARRIDLKPLAVNWGEDDLRSDWAGEYAFCSFACLADWATEKSDQHDRHTLKEGT